MVDDRPEKVEQLAHAAAQFFDVQIIKNLRLLTIRHYNEAVINELMEYQKIILQQQTPETIQALMEEV